MKIAEIDLARHLEEEFKSIYTIISEDFVLVEDLLASILTKAKIEDFLEKETYIIEKNSSWDFLSSENNNLNLFSQKKIIEIKLLNQGPGVKGAKALKDYSKHPDLNLLVVVICENLDKKSHSSAWMKSLTEAGVLIQTETLSKNSLSRWVENKGKNMEINIDKEARSLLIEKTEGNLIATLQEIKKLSLLYPSQDITLNKMKKNIADSSKFNVFDFSNALIKGNKEKSLEILQTLKSEGTPETLILWALSRELNNLLKVINAGSSNGIYGPVKYKKLLEQASKRIKEEKIYKAYKTIAFIDSCIKGYKNQNPWLGLRELTLNF